MSGAYVEKPAADVPPVQPEWPDPPPGWNPNWPPPGTPGLDPDPFFPAPFPPGYTPDYSMVVTATAEIAPDGTASVTGSLRDHSTYATNEPDAIIWTAAIGGEAVQLRFSEGEFASSISSSTAFATYWGAAPSIEFDLTGDNAEDTVVLMGTSVIGGVTVTQTAEIAIAVLIRTITLFFQLTTDTKHDLDRNWFTYNFGKFEKINKETSEEEDQWFGNIKEGKYTGWTGSRSSDDDEFTGVWDSVNHTLHFTVTMQAGYEYDITIFTSTSFCKGTSTFALASLTDGVEDDSKNETIIVENPTGFDSNPAGGSLTIWCTVDGDTGVITIVNPII